MAIATPVTRGIAPGATQATIDATNAANAERQAAYNAAVAAQAQQDRAISLAAAQKTYGDVREQEVTDPVTGQKVTIVQTSSDGGKTWDVYTQDPATKTYQGNFDSQQPNNGISIPAGPTGGTSGATIVDSFKRDFNTYVRPVLDPGEFLGKNGIDSSGTGSSRPPVDAAAASLALAQQYQNAANTFQPGTAPTIQPPSALTAEEIARTQLGQVALAQAPTFGLVAQAQQVGPISAGTASGYGATAGQSTAAQIAQTALAERTRLGPTALAENTQIAPVDQATRTELAPTALSQAAQIAAADQAQFRSDQRGLVTGLQGTIAGTDPSVAALMLRESTDRNIQNQYALAAAARGGNVGLAERDAAINAASINQNAAGQAALLRAQEIATARGQLGGALASGREQDIGLATSQAGLQQQVALANQGAVNTGSITQLGADVQTKLANAGFVNTQNMTQAQLNQAIQLANAGFKNTATTTQAQLDQAQVLANQSALNNTSQVNATLANATGIANAGNTTQAGIASANNQTSASIASANNLTSANTASATLANAANIANAGFTNQANISQAELQAQIAIANANNTNVANLTQAQLDQARQIANSNNALSAQTTSAQLATQTAIANQNAGLTQAQIDAQARQNAAANTLTATGQASQAQIAANSDAQKTEAARILAEAQDSAAKTGAIGAAGAALISDRTKKTDIGDGGLDIGKFLDDLSASGAYEFKYKDPDEPGAARGKRFGVMAQDLEKNRVGRSLVRDTPSGKAIDLAQATGAALAALGELNKRVSGIERRA